jgi:hypothetical protein
MGLSKPKYLQRSKKDNPKHGEGELQCSQDQYTSTKQLLDNWSKELVIAQQFLTTADSLSEVDVIRMVKSINEIHRCAARRNR